MCGGLICLMVVFSPWAFGTTQTWSIWTMNVAGFVLGSLLLAKWMICRRSGYRPVRWNTPPESDESDLIQIRSAEPDRLTVALVVLTLCMLAYTLTSALNWRATYLEVEQRFDYRNCINWLPHSYDRSSTWQAFWMYLGLACFFWATRDWLLGKSSRERRRKHESDRRSALRLTGSEPQARSSLQSAMFTDAAPPTVEAVLGRHPSARLPGRLQLLLWVLCISGSLLALEAILQRLSGTNKLLWFVVPRINSECLQQFGPYAYRANAASYFNLVWPLCLGFWLVLRNSARLSSRSGHRFGSGSYLVLLPGAVLMAACPIISTARGGAIVDSASILATLALLLWATRREGIWFKLGAAALFAIILALAAILGLKDLAPSFQTIFTDQMSRRVEIYENALPIAHDFPVLGTGPGTFGSIYQLYRRTAAQSWAAYVHDDWLETRITFGWLGFSIILLMLCLALTRWFYGGGFPVPREFTMMVWVAIGGCLLHAKFDFPFQVYSILFQFLLLSVVLFCVSGQKDTR
jgi:hypothetical protein